MKRTNAWSSHNKNSKRIEVKVRVGSVTVLEVCADFAAKTYRFGLFNFFIWI